MNQQNDNPWEVNTKKEEELNPTLFDIEEHNDWQSEWQDMPEFIMKRQKPYAELIIRFASQEDLKLFNKVTGLNVNKGSKGTWFPLFTGTISTSPLKSERYYTDES